MNELVRRESFGFEHSQHFITSAYSKSGCKKYVRFATNLHCWYGTGAGTRTLIGQLSVATGYKPAALPIKLRPHKS